MRPHGTTVTGTTLRNLIPFPVWRQLSTQYAIGNRLGIHQRTYPGAEN